MSIVVNLCRVKIAKNLLGAIPAHEAPLVNPLLLNKILQRSKAI